MFQKLVKEERLFQEDVKTNSFEKAFKKRTFETTLRYKL